MGLLPQSGALAAEVLPPAPKQYFNDYANVVSAAASADWTYWRGPQMNGVSTEKNLPDEIDPAGGEGSNLLWKRDIGSRSTREQRNLYLEAGVAAIHYGHGKWNPQGPDPTWTQSWADLDGYKRWLEKKEPETPPQSLIGKAIRYSLSNWEKLIRYLDAWYITPDNNGVENAIRPFVLGRKNWLFANTPRGASASACLYSLVETAKANGLEPYHYLKYLFTYLPSARTPDGLRQLLPTQTKAENL